jgi:hypothetical protein
VAVAVQIRRDREPAGVSRRINACVGLQFNVAETARISTVGSFAFVRRDSGVGLVPGSIDDGA